jgi:hypothetical protein
MAIWSELEECRRRKEIKRYIWGGPAEKEVYVEFREMEDKAREAIEKYVSTPLPEVDKKLELRVCDGILKYLLYHMLSLEYRCERAMSSRLGIPRTRLRRLLANMEWNGIVRKLLVGRSSPYYVDNAGKAMKEGYLTLSPTEAEMLTRISRGMTIAGRRRLLAGVLASLPDAATWTDAYIETVNQLLVTEKPIEQVHVPFWPGGVTSHHFGESDYGIVDPFLRHIWYSGLVRQVLLELDVPSQITPEDIEEGLRRVGEKHLKLTRLMIQPLVDLLEEHGLDEARKMIQKANARDTLLERVADVGKPKGDAKIAPDFVYAKPEGIRGPKEDIPSILGPDFAVIKGHGLVTVQTNELTPTHIRLVANVLRAACNFAELTKADPRLIEESRNEASFLDSQAPENPEQEAPTRVPPTPAS